jgi:hypothetical protein
LLTKFLDLNSRNLVHTLECQALLTGEASSRWTLPSIGPMPRVPDRIVRIDESRAAARVVNREGDRETDLYLYLTKDQYWRISAMRAMATTGILEMIVAESENRKDMPEGEKEMVANARLTLQSDARLARWFGENREGLESLVRAFRATVPEGVRLVRYDPDLGETGPATDAKGRFARDYPEVVGILRELNLNAVSVRENGDLEVNIGGLVDNGVGFIHSPSNSPPPIDPEDCIWVERVADGWYLYRTT